MKNKLKFIFSIFLLIIITLETNAQCAMCKAVLESDLEGGGGAAKGINGGIIYLMFIPYILIGTVGFFIYKHFKKNN